MAIVTDGDLEAARGLPAEFISLSGLPVDRVVDLVSRYWGAFDTRAKIDLINAILPVLEPLSEPSAHATDRDKGVCEAIVATWLARQDTQAR